MTPRSLGVTSVLLGAAMLSLTPAPAQAHPFLRRSVPAAYDTLGTAPGALRLTFSEPIELRFTRLRLLGADGHSLLLGAPTVDENSAGTIVASIAGSLGPGDYIVSWQAAGDDGHVVRGHYTFTVAAGRRPSPDGEAGATAIVPGADSAHAAHHAGGSADMDDAGLDPASPIFVGLRWLLYAGLLGVIGAVVFGTVVVRLATGRGASPDQLAPLRPRTARIGQFGAGLLLLSLPGRLIAQSMAMHGPGEGLDPALVTGMVWHTSWGWSWIGQLGAGLAAFLAFRHVRAGRGGWRLACIAAVILAFTPAFAGHAIAAERWVPLAVLADGLHVLGAAAWLGALAVLVIVGLPYALALGPAKGGGVAADLVNAFSPVALVGAGTAAATGALAAWIHIGHLHDVWSTPYGLVLLIKLGILSVVAATGAYNWRWVRPVLGDEVGTRRVRRSATIEVTVAVIVLAVTAVLVALPTPMAARGP